MKLTGVEFPPVISFATEIHHGIARFKFEARDPVLWCFEIERPRGILSKIQGNADLARIPVAVARQCLAMPVYPSVGIGWKQCLPAQL